MKPQVTRTGLWHGWLGRWMQPATRQEQERERAMRQEMEAARQEMEMAERYFQTVTDPELVDHAIFSMEAARRKYLYLYRQLRRHRDGVEVKLVEEGAAEANVEEESEWT